MSPTEPASVQIALLNGTAAMAREFSPALAPIGKLVELPLHASLEGYALALLVSETDPSVAAAALARLTKGYGALRIFILGNGLSADVAVELIKCGADDYLSVPCDVDTLRRKVERALLGRRGATLDGPEFDLFRVETPPASNRRTSFRAKVPADHPAHVRLPLANKKVARLNLVDISLASDGQLGGMSLTVPAEVAEELAVRGWSRGMVLPFELEIPTLRARIAARAILVRPPAATSPIRQPIRIGLQYSLERSNDGRIIEQFWVECQRLYLSPKA